MTQAEASHVPSSPEKKLKITRENVRWAAAGTTLFLFGFVGETALDRVKDFFFPDLVEEKVIQLQENIDSKTDTIMELSESIKSQLSEIGADSTLGQETSQLIAAIESLRPDIYKAADLSSENLQRLVSAKERELAARGVSASPDIELLAGRGATICGFGNSFGFTTTSSKGTISIQLAVGGRDFLKTINPGATISLQNGSGETIAVNYVGFNDTTNLYAFDVSCP